jgi:hypothetical protein
MTVRLAIVVAMIATTAACVSPTRISIASVDRVRVTSLDGPRARVELAIAVKTNAPIDSTVTVTRYEISFAGAPPIARGGALLPVAVPAGGIVRIVLRPEIALGDLPADLPARVATGRVAYRATVWIDATTSIGRTSHRLEPSGDAPLASTFRAAIDGAFDADSARVVRVGPFGLDGTSFAIGADLEFPGHLPFPITITGAKYRVELDGQLVGRGESTERFVIAPRSGGRGHFELRVPPSRIPKLLFTHRTLTIEGTVEIEPIGPIRRIPFRVTTAAP